MEDNQIFSDLGDWFKLEETHKLNDYINKYVQANKMLPFKDIRMTDTNSLEVEMDQTFEVEMVEKLDNFKETMEDFFFAIIKKNTNNSKE